MSEQMAPLLSALSEQLTFTDDEGVVLAVALLASFYIENTHTRETKSAVAACAEDYFHRCRDHLRWAYNDATDSMEPFGTGKGSTPGTWLPDHPETESYSLKVHGGAWYRGADSFALRMLGHPRPRSGDLGYLQIAFPLPWIAERRDDVIEAVLATARRLAPVSGYGGIGMVECADYGLAQRYESVIYDVAQRFPGFEVDRPSVHSNKLRRGEGGIKGVNWLTIVGDRFLAKLGGPDTVQSAVTALDPRYIVHRHAGGMTIQAGPVPELGDAALNDWPELYVKLAKYLKPIRIVNHGAFHNSGPELPQFYGDNAEAWLSRFEDR